MQGFCHPHPQAWSKWWGLTLRCVWWTNLSVQLQWGWRWVEPENSVTSFSPVVQDHNPQYNQGVFSKPSQKEDEYWYTVHSKVSVPVHRKNKTNADQMHSIQTSPFHLDNSVLVNQLRHKISLPFRSETMHSHPKKGQYVDFRVWRPSNHTKLFIL